MRKVVRVRRASNRITDHRTMDRGAQEHERPARHGERNGAGQSPVTLKPGRPEFARHITWLDS